jgi:hypothetical protein
LAHRFLASELRRHEFGRTFGCDDDTKVIMLVTNPAFTPQTVWTPTATAQVAPTIVKALGLDPTVLGAVRAEGTAVLPEVVGAAREVTVSCVAGSR